MESDIGGVGAWGGPQRDPLVMVSGSRGWDDPTLIARTFSDWFRGEGFPNRSGRTSVTLIHGGARGVDRMAADVARLYGWKLEEHIPEWSRLGKRAGYVRNAAMLARNPEMVFIFWDGESRGTKQVLDHCRDNDVPYRLVTK